MATKYLVHVFEDDDLRHDRVVLAGGRESRVEEISKLVQVVHLKSKTINVNVKSLS